MSSRTTSGRLRPPPRWTGRSSGSSAALLDRDREATAIADGARVQFRGALDVASGNLTVPGEGGDVGAAFGDLDRAYRVVPGAGLEEREEARAAYASSFVPAFR